MSALATTGATLEIDGERIHYIDRGAGPAVLFIHGFGGSVFSWRYAIETLSADHRVIALDLPGFGASDRNPALYYAHQRHAERAVRLLDTLGIQRATIVGHSMGGGIAQRVAATFPERVERLVLVASVDASAPFDRRRSSSRGGLALSALEFLFRFAPSAAFIGRRMTRAMVHDHTVLTPDFVAGYIQPLRTPGTAACLRRLTEDTRDEPPVDLGRISAPTLLIAGEHDRVVPLGTSRHLANHIPGAHLIVVPAAGHLVAEERPDVFATHLQAFLARPAPVSA